MDDPFAMAAEDLAASELGIDAMYQLVSGGPPFPVRMVPSEVEEQVDSAFGNGPGVMAVRVEWIVTAAALKGGRPQKGDLVAKGGESGWIVETVRQDTRRVRFFLGLGRQN